jgi:hypothetical protein
MRSMVPIMSYVMIKNKTFNVTLDRKGGWLDSYEIIFKDVYVKEFSAK